MAPARIRIPRRFLDGRWLPAYAFVAAVLLLSRPEPAGLLVGGLLVLGGAALRVWTLGHLVKTDQLIRSGPYAYLRHPLYAGTLLIGTGFMCAAGPPVGPVAALVLLPLFFLYYLPNKERIESARLERRYGDAFREWRARVPALLPRGRRWPPSPEPPQPGPGWSARRFLASSEAWTLAAVATGLGVLLSRVP